MQILQSAHFTIELKKLRKLNVISIKIQTFMT